MPIIIGASSKDTRLTASPRMPNHARSTGKNLRQGAHITVCEAGEVRAEEVADRDDRDRDPTINDRVFDEGDTTLIVAPAPGEFSYLVHLPGPYPGGYSMKIEHPILDNAALLH
jgi:hypothetical protein